MRTNGGFSLVRWCLVVGVVLGGGFYGYRLWRTPAAPLVEFRTAEVTRGSVVQSVTANGTLSPVRNVEVGSQISGTITAINVDFNSRVKEGDVVAQIDPASYDRALGQAEAELANAEAAEELAQLNFDRARGLYEHKISSKSEYDAARINLNQAKATVKTRQANVDRAKVDLSRTTIYAPMDGIVITRRVEEGQTVAASMNTPTLFIIANDLRDMQIEAAVSEADVGGVEEGQTVQFDVDAFVGRKFDGKVKQVRFEPTTNQSVITYTTIVEVENEDLKLRPGMTANARIITAEKNDVLKVPNAALRFRPPEGAVIRAEAASTALEAERPLIEAGPFAGLPEMPWTAAGERRRPSEEERAAYAASLSADQKQQYEKVLGEMRARMAQAGGGGGGFGGGGGGGFGGDGGGGGPGGGRERRRAPGDGPKTGTLYLVEKEVVGGVDQAVLKPVKVKLGVNDGGNTEILEGVREGAVVAVGTLLSAVGEESNTVNPFNPFSRGRRR